MEDSGKEFGELKSILKGNTSILFSNQGNTPAKLIKNFRKNFDKPILKGAFIDESIYIGDDKIDVLAELKSKEELIGEILTLLTSPINNVLSSLKSGSNKIAGIIKKLSEK
jgi:large subunit ribosomal protein L10